MWIRHRGYAVPGSVSVRDARVSFIAPFVIGELEVIEGVAYVDITPITPALAGIATQ